MPINRFTQFLADRQTADEDVQTITCFRGPGRVAADVRLDLGRMRAGGIFDETDSALQRRADDAATEARTAAAISAFVWTSRAYEADRAATT